MRLMGVLTKELDAGRALPDFYLRCWRPMPSFSEALFKFWLLWSTPEIPYYKVAGLSYELVPVLVPGIPFMYLFDLRDPTYPVIPAGLFKPWVKLVMAAIELATPIMFPCFPFWFVVVELWLLKNPKGDTSLLIFCKLGFGYISWIWWLLQTNCASSSSASCVVYLSQWPRPGQPASHATQTADYLRWPFRPCQPQETVPTQQPFGGCCSHHFQQPHPLLSEACEDADSALCSYLNL